MRTIRAGLLLLLSCSAPATTRLAKQNGDSSNADALGELARNALASGCDAPLPAPKIPTPTTSTGDVLAVYTAHPDDEAMYAGGTMARVAQRGVVTVVTMSHGEGGRLLEIEDGKVVERRDRPQDEVAALRDREFSNATARIGVKSKQLYPASARIDYGWTTSCKGALAHWDEAVPGGVRGMLEKLIADLRERRPRVVLTLDPRDDPQASHHGHHRAVGVLVELAARAAADPAYRVPGGAKAHGVEELLTFAPQGTKADVTLDVGSSARVAMLGEYPSQFRELDDLARRRDEEFVVRWSPLAGRGSVLATLIAPEGRDHASMW